MRHGPKALHERSGPIFDALPKGYDENGPECNPYSGRAAPLSPFVFDSGRTRFRKMAVRIAVVMPEPNMTRNYSGRWESRLGLKAMIEIGRASCRERV